MKELLYELQKLQQYKCYLWNHSLLGLCPLSSRVKNKLKRCCGDRMGPELGGRYWVQHQTLMIFRVPRSFVRG
jgi:hypothetical protein